jgi:hypothetical protein
VRSVRCDGRHVAVRRLGLTTEGPDGNLPSYTSSRAVVGAWIHRLTRLVAGALGLPLSFQTSWTMSQGDPGQRPRVPVAGTLGNG